MGKRKDRKKAIKARVEQIRAHFVSIVSDPQFKENLEKARAEFQERVMASSQIDPNMPRPERCPCGKKWKNCRHRDEILGTHH